jgi:hypothetical protein
MENHLYVIKGVNQKNKTSDRINHQSFNSCIEDNVNCLNCGHMAKGNYCAHCGQKTSTKRFTVVHIFSYDFFHGIYNLNQGFFSTIKEIYTRSGYVVKDYISGKRAEYLNYFSLFILAITLLHFVQDHSAIHIQELFSTRLNRNLLSLNDSIIQSNGKLFAFLLTPIYALFSFLIFKRAKQNYAEHLVINIFKGAASMLLIAVFYLLTLVIFDHTILKLLYVGFSLLEVIYEMVFFYQYFSNFNYTKKQLLSRCLLITSFSLLMLADKWVVIF